MIVIIVLVPKESVMSVSTAERSVIVLGRIATAITGAATVRMRVPY